MLFGNLVSSIRCRAYGNRPVTAHTGQSLGKAPVVLNVSLQRCRQKAWLFSRLPNTLSVSFVSLIPCLFSFVYLILHCCMTRSPTLSAQLPQFPQGCLVRLDCDIFRQKKTRGQDRLLCASAQIYSQCTRKRQSKHD